MLCRLLLPLHEPSLPLLLRLGSRRRSCLLLLLTLLPTLVLLATLLSSGIMRALELSFKENEELSTEERELVEVRRGFFLKSFSVEIM